MRLFLIVTGILISSGFGWLLGQQSPPVPEEDTEVTAGTEDSGLSSYVLVEEDSARFVPSVGTVATKTPIPLTKTPFNLGVVTEALWSSQHAHILGQALENVSGVATHTGFGVFDFFVIRGFDSLSTGLVLVDGAPEPESTFYHLYNVERVEVLKGPGAFLYGGNPLSGSVNLVRKEAAFENFFRAGGSFGAFGTARGQVDFNQKNADNNVAFRLNAFGRRSSGYRDSKTNWQTGFNPSASFQLGRQSFLTLNFEYVGSEYKPDSGMPLYQNQLPAVPRTRSYQSPFDISDQDLYRTRVDFTTVVNGTLTVRNKFYYTDLAWQSDGTIFPAVLPTAEGSVDVYRSLLLLDDRQKLLGNQTEALVTFLTGEVQHKLLLGFEVQRLGDLFTIDVASLPPVDLFDPQETAARPIQRIPQLSQAADTRALVFAPYFLDQITLFDPLTLFLGGRFDLLDFEDKLSGLARDSRQFSPLIGATYSPVASLAIYANAGQAFAPPSSQVVGERIPEESSQIEVGLKKQLFNGKALLTGAVYHLQRNNIAIPDETGLTRQTGSQRSRGFEIDLAGEIDSTWHAFSSYALTDARLTEFREFVDPSFGQFPPILVDRSGNRPAFAPKHIFNLWLIKEFGSGLSFGGGTRYVHGQFIAPDNVFRIDRFLTFNASLAYQREDWRLSLTARNLTNTDYETRGFGSTSVLPADPFAIYLDVDFIR
jgi:iron complex outermembrane receptor protein